MWTKKKYPTYQKPTKYNVNTFWRSGPGKNRVSYSGKDMIELIDRLRDDNHRLKILLERASSISEDNR